MKLTIKKIVLGLGVSALLLSATSCSSLFEETSAEVLTSTQVYKDVRDADAAIIGIYGKFMGLAKQHAVLNELRADLMDVTENAGKELIDINNHDVKEGNSYADARPFYTVIMNCNDVLKNFKVMLQTGKLNQNQYEQRRADIVTLRCWVYLQLGIHFGAVPYVTDALETVTDAQAVASMAKMPLKQLIKELIKEMELIPVSYLDPYTIDNPLVASGLDSYASKIFFIQKHAFMGDLYLWDAQYSKAVQRYKYVSETADRTDGSNNINAWYNCYKITATAMSSGADVITVAYNGSNDASRLSDNNTKNWRSIFGRDRSSVSASASSLNSDPEWLWMLPFDNKYAPQNPFIELFSNVGGSYLIKPSAQAIAIWDGETQINNFSYDARKVMSCKTINGSLVAAKHLYYFMDPDLTGGAFSLITSSVLRRNGRWFLNRAANVHLKIAEAANRDNHSRLAFGLLNNGVRAAFPAPTADVTNYHGYTTDPIYNFDARNGDAPTYRSSWQLNVGIRGRALMKPTPVVGDSTLSIENSIINEGALELAFEGHRWSDLMRVALRRNDPAFLADKVYNKLKKANNPKAEAVRAKLMDPANWYLPFKM